MSSDQASDPGPMRCDVDLDWATYSCPCGDSFCTRFATHGQTRAWLAAHRSHTNEAIFEHTTPGGNRVWASPAPDEIKPYPEDPK